MTILATLFGLALVGAFFAGRELLDRVEMLTAQQDDAQRHIVHLEAQRSRLLAEASALAIECDYLEGRNAYLEANSMHRKQVLAGSMLQRRMVNVQNKLSILKDVAP